MIVVDKLITHSNHTLKVLHTAHILECSRTTKKLLKYVSSTNQSTVPHRHMVQYNYIYRYIKYKHTSVVIVDIRFN